MGRPTERERNIRPLWRFVRALRPGHRGAVVAVAVGLAVTMSSCAGSSFAQGIAVAPAAGSSGSLTLGVSLPTYHYDVAAVGAWERAVGHRADVVQTFVPWEYDQDSSLTDFPTAHAEAIAATGRTLEVTWTPAEPSRTPAEQDISLATIAHGAQDDYVRRFADQVRDSGLHIRLRFAHEMNGSWSDWSEEEPGASKGDFVRAWRHVHDVFDQEGATDVTWVWSPNVVSSTTEPLRDLYPGDSYVDVVGLDGYAYPKDGCPSPEALFGETLTQVRALTSRPVALAEVGDARACADRAAWIDELFAWVRGEGLVGITWWERTAAQGDYRVVGDPASLAALRRSVGASSGS